MGSGGQTVDLSPHGYAVICHCCRFRPGAREGSTPTQRRWLLPPRSQENKRRLPKGDGLEKDEPHKLFVEVYFWLFQLLLSLSFFFVVQRTHAFGVYCLVFGATSKKGQHFNSGEMRRGEKNRMGRGRGLIRKSAYSTEMAVVIQLSPWALKILVLSLGVYLFFLCQNCPPCTQVD